VNAAAAAARPEVKKRAFALLDALADNGLNASEMGAFLLGVALPSLVEGGRTRAEIHKLIDEVLDQRGASS
jgi:hypothetical protein